LIVGTVIRRTSRCKNTATSSFVMLIVQLGLLLATACFGQTYKIPPKEFSVVTPEDIKELCRAAIERGERPSPEGHMFLEFKSGGFRQYVTLTLPKVLFGGFVVIERIDFIQRSPKHCEPS